LISIPQTNPLFVADDCALGTVVNYLKPEVIWCQPYTVSFSQNTGTCFKLGKTDVIITVRYGDDFSSTVTETFTVTVAPKIAYVAPAGSFYPPNPASGDTVGWTKTKPDDSSITATQTTPCNPLVKNLVFGGNAFTSIQEAIDAVYTDLTKYSQNLGLTQTNCGVCEGCAQANITYDSETQILRVCGKFSNLSSNILSVTVSDLNWVIPFNGEFEGTFCGQIEVENDTSLLAGNYSLIIATESCSENSSLSGQIELTQQIGTVCIAEGTYPIDQMIIINNSVRLIGAGSDKTILDGLNQRRVLNVSGSNNSIECLSIIRGRAAAVASISRGGAILNQGRLKINMCSFSNNSTDASTVSNGSSLGGAIYNLGNLEITLSQFLNNQAGVSTPNVNTMAGAIYSDNNSYLKITDSDFIGNSVGTATTGQFGGAIYSSSNMDIARCLFDGNFTNGISNSSFGGAIYITNGTSIPINYNIVNSTFIRNRVSSSLVSAGNGAAIYNDSSFNPAFTYLANVTVVDNSSTQTLGAAVSSVGSLPDINNVLFGNNTPFDSNGNFNVVGAPFTSYIEKPQGMYSQPTYTGLDQAINLVIETTGVGPYAAVLKYNGGPTKTVALIAGSIAINNGNNSGLTHDQRGFCRNGNTDIGSFEYQGFPTKVYVAKKDEYLITVNQPPNDVVTWNPNCPRAVPGLVFGINAFDILADAIAAVCPGGNVCLAANTYKPGLPILIDKDITICGAGATNTILDGSIPPDMNLAPYQAFIIGSNLEDESINVTIKCLTFQNFVGINGGAINSTNTNLKLELCVFTQNQADSGGALAFTNGILTITKCKFDSNKALLTDGGAIYCQLNTNSNRIAESTFINNTSFNAGGAIFCHLLPNTPSRLRICKSLFDTNISSLGGAIYSVGQSLEIDLSKLVRNESERGGAIYARGILFLRRSTISKNKASIEGGGLYTLNALSAGILTVESTTFDHNFAKLEGGAIFNFNSFITITNTTFYSNSTAQLDYDQSGNLIGGGGSISNHSNIVLVNVTITCSCAPRGGGVLNYVGLSVTNSIIAGNHVDVEFVPDSSSLGYDILNLGVVSDNNANFIGSEPGSGMSFPPNRSFANNPSGCTNVSCIFESDFTGKPILKDNGGPTETVNLFYNLYSGPVNPVINSGNNNALAGIKYDQRGYPYNRIVNNNVDMGAVEFCIPTAYVDTNIQANGFSCGDINPTDLVYGYNAFTQISHALRYLCGLVRKPCKEFKTYCLYYKDSRFDNCCCKDCLPEKCNCVTCYPAACCKKDRKGRYVVSYHDCNICQEDCNKEFFEDGTCESGSCELCPCCSKGGSCFRGSCCGQTSEHHSSQFPFGAHDDGNSCKEHCCQLDCTCAPCNSSLNLNKRCDCRCISSDTLPETEAEFNRTCGCFGECNHKCECCCQKKCNQYLGTVYVHQVAGEGQEISIENSVRIIGCGQNTTIITGNELHRVFNIPPVFNQVKAIFENLQISNGFISGPGAGILNDSNNVYVKNCLFLENEAVNNAHGGAIANITSLRNANLYILESTFGKIDQGNFAFNGGAVSNVSTVVGLIATLIINKSTFSYNNARTNGGAIFIHGYTAIKTNNSTYAYNISATLGGAAYVDGSIDGSTIDFEMNGNTLTYNFNGGIYFLIDASITKITLNNNIIVGNGNSGVYLSAPNIIHNNNANFIGNENNASSSGGMSFGLNANLSFATNPMTLSQIFECTINNRPILKYNGGPTPTIALVPGSPVINYGKLCFGSVLGPNNTTNCPSNRDQRGYTRVIFPDLGAFELLGRPCVVYVSLDYPEYSSFTEPTLVDWSSGTGCFASNLTLSPQPPIPFDPLTPATNYIIDTNTLFNDIVTCDAYRIISYAAQRVAPGGKICVAKGDYNILNQGVYSTGGLPFPAYNMLLYTTTSTICGAGIDQTNLIGGRFIPVPIGSMGQFSYRPMGVGGLTTRVSVVKCLTIKEGNPAEAGGGVIDTTGKITFKDCAFVQNQGRRGGAIFLNRGVGDTEVVEFISKRCEMFRNFTVSVTGSQIFGGGAISVNFRGDQNGLAYITLIETSIHNNASRTQGGAIETFGRTNLYIQDSAIYSNTVSYDTVASGRDMKGGGIFLDTGTRCVISNSTIHGNTYNLMNQMNFLAYGGGIYYNQDPFNVGNPDENRNSSLIMYNTTICHNSSYYGGGIFFNAEAAPVPPLMLVPAISYNTIIANNTVGTPTATGLDVDGDVDPPTVSQFFNNVSAYNLIGTGDHTNMLTSLGIKNGENGNQIGTNDVPINPQFANFSNHGGCSPTESIALNSPARNAGSNQYAVDIYGYPLQLDQRGFPRIVQDIVDIGAYEYYNCPIIVECSNQTLTFQVDQGTCKAQIAFNVIGQDGFGNPALVITTITQIYSNPENQCNYADKCLLNKEISSGDYLPVGSYELSSVAIDRYCGRSYPCKFTVIIIDNEAPEIHCPEDVEIECNDDANTNPLPLADVNVEDPGTGIPWVQDNCDLCPTLSYVDSEREADCGSTFHFTRTWTATDACGNSSSCNQLISIVDTVPPVFTVPTLQQCATPITRPADEGKCCATYEFTFTAHDDCEMKEIQVQYSGPVDVIECTPTFSNENKDLSVTCRVCFPVGVTTFNATAFDQCNNSVVSCIQTITVTNTQSPVINCPPDIKTFNDPGLCTGTVKFQVTASDNCSFSSNEIVFTKTITVDGVPFPDTGMCMTTFPNPFSAILECEYQLPSNCDFPYVFCITATNSFNISTTCCFNVTVEDTEDPVFNDCPGNQVVITSNTDGNCGACYIFNTVIAHDNCGIVSINVQYISPDPLPVCPNQPPVPEPLCPDSCTYTDNDGNPIILPSGSNQDVNIECTHFYPIGVTTVIVTVTDNCGNSASCTFTVTVIDNEPPVITCPPNAIVECNESTDPTHTGRPIISDNCKICCWKYRDTSSRNSNPKSCAHYNYVIYRLWIAKDCSGNASPCIQKITVRKTKGPVLIGVPCDIEVDCDQIPPVACVSVEDICDSNIKVTCTERIYKEDPNVAIIQRTWRAVDVCGNVGSKSQLIRVCNQVGGVLFYLWRDGQWVSEELPLYDNIAECSLQGSSVSVYRNQVAIGGPKYNHGKGAIWVWTRRVIHGQEVWEKNGPITICDSDNLGSAVSISDNILTASTADGKVYTWRQEGDEWVLLSQVLDCGRSFGSALSIYNNILAVGVPRLTLNDLHALEH
jgi:hypothetical protein